MDEHGEHRYLRGSDRQSVISYVHERVVCRIAVCLLSLG
jgi:hypothetical protein